jgi:CRP/FNR family transcriptional regulator
MNPSVAICFLGNPCTAPSAGINGIGHLRHVARAEPLYHAGDDFHGLFQVVRGSFKTFSSTISGVEQILDFHFPGEFMGMDAISEDEYPSTAVALEDGEVYVISYRRLNELCAVHRDVHNNLHIAMSNEIRRNTDITTLLGYTRPDARIAIFLLDLLERTNRAGRLTDRVPLPMKRRDIASFLGMASETLCRELARFQRQRLIKTDADGVNVLDKAALERFKVSTTERCSSRARPRPLHTGQESRAAMW